MCRVQDQLREQDLVGAFVDLPAVRAFVEQSVLSLTRKRHIFAIEQSSNYVQLSQLSVPGARLKKQYGAIRTVRIKERIIFFW